MLDTFFCISYTVNKVGGFSTQESASSCHHMESIGWAQ